MTVLPPGASRSTEAPTLVVADIHKAFRTGVWPRRRSNEVLRGVSFELLAGTMVGLVGENGSGKSVLMRIIAGSLKQDHGTVVLGGRLGYCPQVPMLYEKLTFDETFALFGRAYSLITEETRARANRRYEVLSFARFRSDIFPQHQCPLTPCENEAFPD